MDFPIHFAKIKLVTASGVYQLNTGGTVDYLKLVRALPGFSYEPEYFHAPILKRQGISFTVFASGKVIITGVKSESLLYDVVLPTLLEMELLLA